MSDLIPFSYEGNQVRTISKDGEPWFVAKDACEILDLSNVGQALSRLDDDEKNTIILNDGTPGNPNIAIVNEPGLYGLILASRKPEAKSFKRWVTHEVIPSIRKTGSYSAKPMTELQALQQTVNALVQQEERIKQLEGTTQTIKDTIITQPDNWREDLNRMFNKIVKTIGGKKFQELRSESYKLLEERAHVDLNRRLIFYKSRLEQQGISKTKINQSNRLDVIEQDPKLREIYSKIIQEYTIRFVA